MSNVESNISHTRKLGLRVEGANRQHGNDDDIEKRQDCRCEGINVRDPGPVNTVEDLYRTGRRNTWLLYRTCWENGIREGENQWRLHHLCTQPWQDEECSDVWLYSATFRSDLKGPIRLTHKLRIHALSLKITSLNQWIVMSAEWPSIEKWHTTIVNQ
jgi:hypothetical protein